MGMKASRWRKGEEGGDTPWCDPEQFFFQFTREKESFLSSRDNDTWEEERRQHMIEDPVLMQPSPRCLFIPQGKHLFI